MTKKEADEAARILREAGFTDAEPYRPDPMWHTDLWLVDICGDVIDSIHDAEELIADWENL